MGKIVNTEQLNVRLLIYTKALDFIQCKAYRNSGVYTSGLCYALILFSDITGISCKTLMEKFPEVLVQKPENVKYSDFWFSINKTGTKKRIQILKRAIRAVKAEIKKQNCVE